MEGKWYILYTKVGAEKKVAALLTRKGIQNFCPLNVFFDPKNSHKRILKPLFKNFVFVNLSPEELFQLRQLNGVRSIVYWLNVPAQVTPGEIIAIKELLETYNSLQLEKVPVNVKEDIGVISVPYFEGQYNGSSCCHMTKTVIPSLGYALIANSTESKRKPGESVIVIIEKFRSYQNSFRVKF